VRLVLASASPRRAEILRTLGLPFEVSAPDVDEAVVPGETPRAHAERLARAKALAVARSNPSAWVLGGDTVVTVDGDILGKPGDAEAAIQMLLRLQGRTHEVVSGLALCLPAVDGDRAVPNPLSGVEVTAVTLRAFDRSFAQEYVATGEPLDKAGAYGIQGKGAALVRRIEGDYTGVVGLPVPLLLGMLARVGVPYRFDGSAA